MVLFISQVECFSQTFGFSSSEIVIANNGHAQKIKDKGVLVIQKDGAGWIAQLTMGDSPGPVAHLTSLKVLKERGLSFIKGESKDLNFEINDRQTSIIAGGFAIIFPQESLKSDYSSQLTGLMVKLGSSTSVRSNSQKSSSSQSHYENSKSTNVKSTVTTQTKNTSKQSNQSHSKAIPEEASIVPLSSLKSAALRAHANSIAFQREMPYENIGKRNLSELLAEPLGITSLSWKMNDVEFLNKLTSAGYGYEGTYKYESYHTLWTDVHLNIGIELSNTINIKGYILTFLTSNKIKPSLTIAYDNNGNFKSVNASIAFVLSNLIISQNKWVDAITNTEYNKAIEDYYTSLLKNVQSMGYKISEKNKDSFRFKTNSGIDCTISYRLDKYSPHNWSNITIQCYKSK